MARTQGPRAPGRGSSPPPHSLGCPHQPLRHLCVDGAPGLPPRGATPRRLWTPAPSPLCLTGLSTLPLSSCPAVAWGGPPAHSEDSITQRPGHALQLPPQPDLPMELPVSLPALGPAFSPGSWRTWGRWGCRRAWAPAVTSSTREALPWGPRVRARTQGPLDRSLGSATGSAHLGGVLPCRSLCPLTAKCHAQVQQVPARGPWGPRRPHPPRLPSASQHSQLQVWKGQVPETAARWELGCEPPRRQAGRVRGASVLQMGQPNRGSERAESWSSQSPGGGLVISRTTGPGRASHPHNPPPAHTGTRVHTRTQVRTHAQAYAQKSEDTRTHMPSSSSTGEWFPGQNLIPPGVSGQNPHSLFQEPSNEGFHTPWERGALSPSRC